MNKEKDKALHLIKVGIGLTFIILIIISWRYQNYAFNGTTIDADITSS